MNTEIPAKRWRYIIPMAVVMYILAYVDRINVAMILPYIDKNFGLSAAIQASPPGSFSSAT